MATRHHTLRTRANAHKRTRVSRNKHTFMFAVQLITWIPRVFTLACRRTLSHTHKRIHYADVGLKMQSRHCVSSAMCASNRTRTQAECIQKKHIIFTNWETRHRLCAASAWPRLERVHQKRAEKRVLYLLYDGGAIVRRRNFIWKPAHVCGAHSIFDITVRAREDLHTHTPTIINISLWCTRIHIDWRVVVLCMRSVTSCYTNFWKHVKCAL